MRKTGIWFVTAALPALLAVAGCPQDHYAPAYGVQIDDDDTIADDDTATDDDSAGDDDSAAR